MAATEQSGKVDAGPALAGHGAVRLPTVDIDSYNIEIKDENGYVGDRARKAAFQEALEAGRKPLRAMGLDPLGDQETTGFSRKALDKLLVEGTPPARALIQGAIETYAGELAYVVRRLMRAKPWKDTQRIVIGGGFRESDVGEIAIARAEQMLRAEEIDIALLPIRNHPDEAGLIGAVHLAPSWMFAGHDSILAVDIGGTNMRAGIVAFNLKKKADLSKASVLTFDLWRHADEELKREDAVDGLIGMLEELVAHADKEKLKLAPFIGIGCPGEITADGGIETGAQNLPGNWESSRFNLPAAIRKAIPTIDGAETVVLMHNDAVVQGLSEVPFMADVARWGVLTIGTGLGNARFTNRKAPEKDGD